MANTDSGSVAVAPPQRSRREYWQKLIEECQGSGLSQAAFCRQHGIKRRSLSFWKWKLSRGPGASGRPRRPRARAFVPIRVVAKRPWSSEATPAAARAWDGEIELVLEPGRLVRVRGRVDAEWLQQVMGIVAAPRC